MPYGVGLKSELGEMTLSAMKSGTVGDWGFGVNGGGGFV